LHYGGQLAAPVFKDVATKLYAQYVKGKKILPFQLTPDSSYYSYAGYTNDVRNILNELHVAHIDSAGQQAWSLMYNNNYQAVVKQERMSGNTMPDVRNMTLKDALYLLENMNLNVSVRGKGKVVAQDILPGTGIRKNQTVTLLLNQ